MILFTYLFLNIYIYCISLNKNKLMEDIPLNHEQLKAEYEKLKMENEQLKKKIQNDESNSPFAKALERKLVNSMLGREY